MGLFTMLGESLRSRVDQPAARALQHWNAPELIATVSEEDMQGTRGEAVTPPRHLADAQKNQGTPVAYPK